MFAKRLKGLMKEQGLTLRDLADATGVTPQSVHGWLNGSLPRDGVLVKLARHLRVSPNWLRYGEGEGESPPLDRDLLAEVLTALDASMREHGVTLTPDKKAGIAAALYDLVSSNNAKLTQETVASMIAVAR